MLRFRGWWLARCTLGILDSLTETQTGLNRKTNKGTAWAEVWNKMVSQCVGFERAAPHSGSSFPCHPSMVVYGHAASRGLDVRRWTVGLDTGCVCYAPHIPC